MKAIPFLSLKKQHHQIRTAIQEALMQVYDKSVFVMGEELQLFEKEFAAFCGTGLSVGVGNGLDALTLALHSCNLSPGDEVIVPAHTYIATWLAVSRCGLRIVPVEPDEKTMNIDPSKIEAAITPRTRAITPVHLYGLPCDMAAIEAAAAKHDLLIIEDNAQAHGAKWNDRVTGSFGMVNATSFYPTKNLGALGDGGAVTTSDPSIAERVRQYRNYGFAQKDVAVQQGVNSRLDEIQAAVLRIKLQCLGQWTEDRRNLAAFYHRSLGSTGDVILPFVPQEAYHVYHLFVIRTAFRDKLKNYLAGRGIETMIHYPVPPHLQKAYAQLNFRKGDFPLTEKVADTALSLPLWPGLDPEEIEFIADSIRRFFHTL